MFKIPANDFNLALTLLSGQTFSWEKVGDSFVSSRNNKEYQVSQVKNQVTNQVTCTVDDQDFLRAAFRLDDNLSEIYSELSKDKIIKRAIEANKGLRVIKDEPFECLISYICSANSNIPNIFKMTKNLRQKFGKNKMFPTPKELAKASLEELRECKLGFRAKYVLEVAKKISSGEFDIYGLEKLSYQEAKEKLVSLPGVGEKIADCVLLYSFGKLEAFPVDTWIRKVMTQNYFNGKKVSDKEIRKFAENKFGKYAGYAQLYLFHYFRTKAQGSK